MRNKAHSGEKNGNSKVSDLQILEMRKIFRVRGYGPKVCNEVAQAYGLHPNYVYKIADGQVHSFLVVRSEPVPGPHIQPKRGTHVLAPRER